MCSQIKGDNLSSAIQQPQHKYDISCLMDKCCIKKNENSYFSIKLIVFGNYLWYTISFSLLGFKVKVRCKKVTHLYLP